MKEMQKLVDLLEEGEALGKPSKRLVHHTTYGNIWLYILSIIKNGKEYAYAMPDIIYKEFGFKPNKIMVYIVLYKLESDGYIKGKYENRRKYYTITERGAKLISWASSYLHTLSRYI